MKTIPWPKLRARKSTPKQMAKVDRAVRAALLEMDLRELREMRGVTQKRMATLLRKVQPEVSRLERRSDYRLSTLQRFVAALGGELEVIATFGDRRVRLHAADGPPASPLRRRRRRDATA